MISYVSAEVSEHPLTVNGICKSSYFYVFKILVLLSYPQRLVLVN